MATGLGLTSDELMQGLEVLTEVGTHDEFVLLSDVLGLSVLADANTHPDGGSARASNVQGPFYLPGAPTLVYFQGDPWLDSDSIGSVKGSLVVGLQRRHRGEEMAERGVDRPFFTCRFDATLAPATESRRMGQRV